MWAVRSYRTRHEQTLMDIVYFIGKHSAFIPLTGESNEYIGVPQYSLGHGLR